MGVDISGLKEFQSKLRKLKETELDSFYKDCTKELAARLLALVIPITPKGEYETSTGKQGGTLQRGWTVDTEQQAMSSAGTPTDSEQKAYINACTVTKDGDSYYIDVTNPVFYASYVEYGHRKVNGGWQGGRFMLKISEQQLISITPGILEAKLERMLREAIGD